MENNGVSEDRKRGVTCWRRGGVGFDRFEFFAVLLVGVVQVPAQLKVHPEIR